MALERISIELTQRCRKACAFCYAGGRPDGPTGFEVEELVRLVSDCATHGVRAVSLGGGEPLEYGGIFELLSRLRGVVFRSLTTNGLLLDEGVLERLRLAAPDKVHVSIHFPGDAREVERVAVQVQRLEALGIRSGVNLLVARSTLEPARAASQRLRAAGIGSDRLIYIPMRGRDTPGPRELARVAGGSRFQSASCLLSCAPSPRFCAIGWDRTVAPCSYTRARRDLEAPTYAALVRALTDLAPEFCGGNDDERVRLPRRSQHGYALVRGGS